MPNFSQNEILPLFVCMLLLLKWAPERTMYYAVYFSASVTNTMFLPSWSLQDIPALCLVTWGILAAVAELWDTFNCDPGFILCSAVLWKHYWVESYTIKCVLWCEFCSEGNNTFPFWKEVLHVSVSIIIQKYYKETKKALIHHVLKCWSNVFLNVFSVTFQTFKLGSLRKQRRLDVDCSGHQYLLKKNLRWAP